MHKSELKKLAERGIIEELRSMQAKLNEWAREFPHLVRNKDGSIPSVMPIEYKNGHKPGQGQDAAGYSPAAIHKAAGAAIASRKGGKVGKKRNVAQKSGRTPRRAPGESAKIIRNYLADIPSGKAESSELAEVLGISASGVYKALTLGIHRDWFTSERGAGPNGRHVWSLTDVGKQMAMSA